MMQRPELIDVLADELTPESFYFADNAEGFRAVMAVRSANKAVDFLTVAEQGTLLARPRHWLTARS